MEIGKLYQTKELYWFLFPSLDKAIAVFNALDGAANFASYARRAAEYWSIQLNCNVSFISPQSMFVLLEQDIRHSKILTTEGNIGWIYLPEWCKEDIEEVKAE